MIRFEGYSHHAMAYACESPPKPLAAVSLLGLNYPRFVKVQGRNKKLLNSRRGRMPYLKLIAFRGYHPACCSSPDRAGSTMFLTKPLFFHLLKHQASSGHC